MKCIKLELWHCCSDCSESCRCQNSLLNIFIACNFASLCSRGSLQYCTVMLPLCYCPPDTSTHLSPYLSIWTSKLVQTSSHYRLPGGENRYRPCSANSRRPLTVAAARSGPARRPAGTLFIRNCCSGRFCNRLSPSWCPILTIRRENSKDVVYKTGGLELASSDRACLNRSFSTLTAQTPVAFAASDMHATSTITRLVRHNPSHLMSLFFTDPSKML